MFASLSTFDQVAITKQDKFSGCFSLFVHTCHLKSARQHSFYSRRTSESQKGLMTFRSECLVKEYEEGKSDVRGLVARKTF